MRVVTIACLALGLSLSATCIDAPGVSVADAATGGSSIGELREADGIPQALEDSVSQDEDAEGFLWYGPLVGLGLLVLVAVLIALLIRWAVRRARR